ncbi:DUF6415 family natural product biosynthesis protein [Streptomyces sp. CB03238]|uniref:DUF6415 family natural product biosynthesis protein n=1 Tax=Streptomyces sp. CB03238 TaxID=1907777 RepID=UPI001F4F0576|nr:DUF6415 family natural product biosynthesis protein [Streptomyces sp. CB03238]
MVAVTAGVAAQLLTRRTSVDHDTLGTLLYSLRRSLASEAIDEQLYDDLDAVLDEYARPAPHEVTSIAKRFRQTTTKIVEVVPYLVRPYPVEAMRRLIYLSAEHPHPDDALGHLRRFAVAILAILDLMGDTAP